MRNFKVGDKVFSSCFGIGKVVSKYSSYHDGITVKFNGWPQEEKFTHYGFWVSNPLAEYSLNLVESYSSVKKRFKTII